MAARPSDIVVVGAGIVGCGVAYELARRGASVDVIDDRPAGMGSTHASGGMFCPYIEAHEGNPLLDLGARSLGLVDQFVSRASTDSGMEVSYHGIGTLDVAMQEDELVKMRETAALLERRGVPSELLDAQTVRAEEPHLAPGAAGGLVIPVHGFVRPAELTQALAAAARRHGAQIVEGARVRRIVRANGDLVVETERGRLVGNAVVIAAGTWSGRIEIPGAAPAPVRPVRGQLLNLAWNGQRLRRITWAAHRYLVPWDDGTLLVGATSEEAGFDERATAAGVRDLLEAACEIVPHGWTAGFLRAKVGLRPATPDDLPIIGWSQVLPNLMYATGHYRSGVLLAPLTAGLVADAMLDGRLDPGLDALSPGRFGAL